MENLFRRAVILLFVICTPFASSLWAGEMSQHDLSNWYGRIRNEHPRMFFTRETWPQVKAYTLNHERDYYEKMKARVAAFPEQADATVFEKGANVKYGPYAQTCAFIWLMEGDRKALAKAKNYLLEAVKFYNRRSSAGEFVNWYSCSRVSAMTTYDWIYDQLTPEDRRDVALGFFKHYRDCLAGRRLPGQNRGGIATGFYGPPNMAWYVGLTFHKDGANDDEAERLLKKGYEEHLDLLRYRGHSAGDDGGIGSVAVGYGFGMYPWAEFNFMHTFNSATGMAIERQFDHLSLFPNWVVWNWIPGGWRYGLADACPAGRMGGGAFLEMHMLQIAHFFAARNPDRAGLALWVRDKLLGDRSHDDYWWPLAPFFVTRCGELPGPQVPDASWPLARNFENMGLVFMHSGWDESDVHAAFVAGGDVNQHRHYDQGHFIIYKKGFLALDSGAYGRARDAHLTEYLYRTVAHNCILIHAPDADKPATIWGGLGKTLDGGQYAFQGRQAAFETNAAYTYAAADATQCYFPDKCSEAVRQFVFVPPDHFVICDRVTATEARYKKSWLLHSADEPQVADDGVTFRIEQDQGALLCRTVFPRDAGIEKVGGPGKEFWSAGANHPVSRRRSDLSGAWRVEVSPKAAREKDVFVHLIRVGDRTMGAFGQVEPVQDANRVGVRFRTDTDEVTVTFNTSGEIGGHITITGKAGIDQPLTRELQPQAGTAAAPEG